MNCEELEPWISAYQDGELDPRRRRIVEAHLASCRACQALGDGWEDLARDLRVSLWRLDAPESLHPRVMRRIPEPVWGLGARSGFRWRRGWLSFALAPVAAATGWLLWGARPVSRAPLPAQTSGMRMHPVEAAGPLLRAGAIQTFFPGDPMGPQLARLLHPRTNSGEQKKPDDHSKVVPAHGAQPGKAQGRRPAGSDAMRRLRRLRPRRMRYPLAEYHPGDPPRRWRHHPWPLVASRLGTAPMETASPAPEASAHIRIVEYVLPAIQPSIPAADPGSASVLRSAPAAPVIEAGFDL